LENFDWQHNVLFLKIYTNDKNDSDGLIAIHEMAPASLLANHSESVLQLLMW